MVSRVSYGLLSAKGADLLMDIQGKSVITRKVPSCLSYIFGKICKSIFQQKKNGAHKYGLQSKLWSIECNLSKFS